MIAREQQLQNSTQPPTIAGEACVRRSFLVWVEEYNPDYVSKTILSSLLCKYEKGNKLPLFEKFKQLIDSEHYVLATIFRDCLTYIGVNDEFKAWLLILNGK